MRRTHAVAPAFALALALPAALVFVSAAAPALAQAPTAAGAPKPAAAEPASDLPVLYGMHWGDPVQPGMEQEHVEGLPPNRAFYKRAADRLALDTAPLEAVHYVFDDGRLAGFSLQFAQSDKAAVVAAATKLWGNPSVQSGTHFWLTPSLIGKMREVANTSSITLSLYAPEPPPPGAGQHPAQKAAPKPAPKPKP